MTADFDFVIIGGGVIGLACARALASTGSVLLIEQHNIFGSETSSRNSEVIHAGLYYPSGSLKERLCIDGRKQLYHFCDSHDIPHQRIGKLIVSPSANNPKLNQLEEKARLLGIPLQHLDKSDINQIEPSINAASALLSTETGIIDSHTYMERLAQDAERLGAILMKQTRFIRAKHNDCGWHVELDTNDGLFHISTNAIINAAGLHSHQVAQSCGISAESLPPLYFCRGHYFSYQGRSPFKHLVYPLPEQNLTGLGIHATIDLGGQVRFGPDAEYLTHHTHDYAVDAKLRDRFARAIKEYFPNINEKLLQPAYAGIRPKLYTQQETTADFVIRIENEASNPPLVNLLGIESPGLTSSLAIANEVVDKLKP